MRRPRVSVIRYAPVIREIAEVLGVRTPEYRIGQGRVTLIFRQLGASKWPSEERIEYAFHVASVARSVFAQDRRWMVRRRATKAVVVIFDDVDLERGCDVEARWKCVVPAQRLLQ